MSGFKLVRNPNQSDLVEELPISSITVQRGDMLMRNKGASTWVLATSSLECWQEKAVADSAATTADTVVLGTIVLPGQIWEAESVNNASASDNGDRMTLTDENTVNNSHSDVDTVAVSFIQKGFAGAAADKRLLGNIIYGSGATQVN